MHLKLTAADKTDVGKQREQNEDSAYKRIESTPDGDRGLFVVADGMGGYKAGEVASRLAVETISKTLDSFFKPITEQPTIRLSPITVKPENLDDTDKTMKLPPVGNSKSLPKTQKLSESALTPGIEDQLTSAIQQANRAILRYGEQQTAARGLGSTVTVVLIYDNQAFIANVGDSRTYLLRNNQLTTLTKDHSLVQKLVETKQIEPEDVYTHPQRNLIYRSLGAGHRSIEVDIFHETIQPGDIFLLCSDGLWEMVRPLDLKKTLGEQVSPQKVCDSLINMANDSGGEDNITAVVVHVNQH
jgi:serine/threonine protein phosphatase PrpC